MNKIIENQELDFGEPGERFKMRAIAFGLEQGFKKPWRSQI
jgi:hypothetical protein